MLAALAVRDVAAVYRLLQKHGVSQRQIAALTGQSQSEISEILGGRKVIAYDLLVRIAEGLGVDRGLMGLAHVDPMDDPVGASVVQNQVAEQDHHDVADVAETSDDAVTTRAAGVVTTWTGAEIRALRQACG
jgi:transcriptional regulator with XRE-family HTH domain